MRVACGTQLGMGRRPSFTGRCRLGSRAVSLGCAIAWGAPSGSRAYEGSSNNSEGDMHGDCRTNVQVRNEIKC